MFSFNIKNKLNGCCYILASRSSRVKSVDSFFTYYKYAYKYPLFIFYFDEPFDKKLKNSLINKHENIIFEKVDYKIPEKISKSELF